MDHEINNEHIIMKCIYKLYTRTMNVCLSNNYNNIYYLGINMKI